MTWLPGSVQKQVPLYPWVEVLLRNELWQDVNIPGILPSAELQRQVAASLLPDIVVLNELARKP